MKLYCIEFITPIEIQNYILISKMIIIIIIILP